MVLDLVICCPRGLFEGSDGCGVEEWEAESEGGGAGQLRCILSGQEAECVTFGVRFTR